MQALAASQDAVQQLGALRKAAREAHQRGDQAAYLEASRRLYDFLHGSAQATLQMIAADLYAGNEAAALAGLHDYVAMGGDYAEALKDAKFDTLRAAKGFAAESAGMARNAEPEIHAKRALTLKPREFVPEDIDFDSSSDTFYLTSVLNRRIVRIKHLTDVRMFALAPDPWPMMAIKVDGARRRIWATEMAAGEGASAVLQYDFAGRLLRKIPGPPGSQLGDLAILSDGTAMVADGEGGGLYQAKPAAERLERIDHGDFVSPQTPCPLPDGHVLVPDYVRGIGKFDPASGEVRWLTSSAHQLTGIDGLYLYGLSLIATQNGVSPERVVRFAMDGTFTTILSESIIERSTPTLGDPTHGVVVGKYFYYIANSGWPELDEHARKKPGAKMSAPMLMRAPLPP